MTDGEEPGSRDEPSPMPPDPFALGQASSVQLHEGYTWLRSGGFSMVESLIYLAASGAVNTMIAAQEAVHIIQRDMPEQPGED